MTTFANAKSIREDFPFAQKSHNEYLHFEFACDSKHAYQKLRQLRDEARKSFARVSKLYRLFGNDCLIQSQKDPLRYLKLHARQMVMIGDSLRMISPITILAFACELDNEEVCYFGLAEYPDTVEHEGQKVHIRNARQFLWKSFVSLSSDAQKSNKNYMVLMMEIARDLDILSDYSFS